MENDFILSNLCLPHSVLQEGMIKQILSDVAVKIQLSAPCSEEDKFIQLAINLVPYICDPEFSSLWLSLLPTLSTISDKEALNFVYNQINLKQAELFPCSSLPSQFLHCLWLSHLPSLEFSVLMTLQKISEAPCFPNYMLEMLAKSYLSEVASKEPLIFQTIFNMLNSLLEQSDYSATLVEFLALFCQATQRTVLNVPLITMKPKSMKSLQSMLNFSPDDLSPTLIGKTLSKLYDTFVMCRDKHSGNLNIFNEDFWSLTVEYRHWILAALNSILHCDLKDIQVCLWLLLAHNRINQTMSEYTAVERQQLLHVHHIRSILHSSLTPDDIHGLKKYFNQLLVNKSSLKPEIVEQLILQILVVFIFHSKSGFRFGQEFITSQSNAQAEAAIKHLIYYHQLMPDLHTRWDSEKRTLFQKFIEYTILWSDSNHCCKIYCDELRVINKHIMM
ncbi:hypothetical protein Btru_018540 [Bulinus truncatus]|nr:hypothetical protein Btru_018540 [Bulinus truncatus]